MISRHGEGELWYRAEGPAFCGPVGRKNLSGLCNEDTVSQNFEMALCFVTISKSILRMRQNQIISTSTEQIFLLLFMGVSEEIVLRIRTLGGMNIDQHTIFFR